MRFSIRPVIDRFDDFHGFALQEQLSREDLIFTTEGIYDVFLKEDASGSPVLFLDRYGRGEPTDEMIDTIRRDIPDDVRRIIAVGGGSVIDIAKVLTLSWDGDTEDLFMGRSEAQKIRHLTVLPTTCGTGSEVTNVSVVALTRQNTKKGLALDLMYADTAVLIPQLVRSLPYKFFATSSIDAMIHATESYMSPKATAFSRMYSVEALKKILTGYLYMRENGNEHWTDLAEDFLIASTYGGIAFGNAGCGAVHAMSYPLGGTYHIPHGESNMLMFAEVFRMYRKKQPVGRINDLEKVLGEILKTEPERAFDALEDLMESVLPIGRLHEYGVKEEDLPVFTKSVIEGQQRLLNNNYVPLTEDEMIAIYQARY